MRAIAAVVTSERRLAEFDLLVERLLLCVGRKKNQVSELNKQKVVISVSSQLLRQLSRRARSLVYYPVVRRLFCTNASKPNQGAGVKKRLTGKVR